MLAGILGKLQKRLWRVKNALLLQLPIRQLADEAVVAVGVSMSLGEKRRKDLLQILSASLGAPLMLQQRFPSRVLTCRYSFSFSSEVSASLYLALLLSNGRHLNCFVALSLLNRLFKRDTPADLANPSLNEERCYPLPWLPIRGLILPGILQELSEL